MQERFIAITGLMRYIKFLYRYHTVEIKFLRWPF